MAGKIYDIIDSLNIGSDWKKTFKKIHISYYKNYSSEKRLHPIFWVTTSELSALSMWDSLKLYTWFNPLGLIFGPFYYVFNGLYKKGIIMLAIFLLLLYCNDVTRIISLFIFVYCAFFINIDCFEKKVLNHPDVKSNPLIVGDDYDEVVLNKLLVQKTNPLPYILLIAILLSPVAYGIHGLKAKQDSLKNLVSEPQKICDSKQECVNMIKKHLQEINSIKDKKEISEQYYNIALTYYSIEDIINSIKSLDTSINFNNENINAYLLRAKIYGKMQNNVQALLDYKEALHINPQATFLNYYIGHNYYALGKYERALEYFERATKSNEVALYYEAQGYTRQMLKDTPGAIKDIKKAIALYNKEENIEKVKKLGVYLKKISKKASK